MRQHRIALAHALVGGDVGVADQGADAQAAIGRLLDLAQRQAADVDQVRRLLDVELHQVEQVGAAGDERRAGLGWPPASRPATSSAPLVGEGPHARSPLRVRDGRHDLRIGRAAADVAAHPLADLRAIGVAAPGRGRRLAWLARRAGSRPACRPPSRSGPACSSRTGRRRARRRPPAADAACRGVASPSMVTTLVAFVRDGQRQAGIDAARRSPAPCRRRTGRGRSPSWRRSRPRCSRSASSSVVRGSRSSARLPVDGERTIVFGAPFFESCEGKGMVCACSSRTNIVITTEATPSTRLVNQ